MRRAFRESGVEGRLRLAFTDCLGPCSEANVVFVYLPDRPIWLRRVSDVDAFRCVVDWARSALDDGADGPLPPALATRAFAWAGSREGPAPPIEC